MIVHVHVHVHVHGTATCGGRGLLRLRELAGVFDRPRPTRGGVPEIVYGHGHGHAYGKYWGWLGPAALAQAENVAGWGVGRDLLLGIG